MKFFIRSLFCCFLLTAVPGLVLYSQPRIKVIGKSEFSFGKIYKGAVPAHRVRITNAGRGKLEITNLSSPCGCSTQEINKKILLPKDTAVVTIRFNSDIFLGRVQKAVHIVSNDPEHTTTTLNFTADVQTLLDVEPPLLAFSNKENAAGMKKSLRVTNISGKRITILSVFDATYFTDLVFAVKRLSPGETALIGVSAKPVGEMGRSGEILIKTDSKEQRTVKISYFVEGSKK